MHSWHPLGCPIPRPTHSRADTCWWRSAWGCRAHVGVQNTHTNKQKRGGLVNSRFRVCDRRPELRPDHRASNVFEVGDVIQRVVQARGDSVNIIREKSSNIDPRHAEVSSLNLSHSSTWPRSFTKKSKLNCTQSLVLLTAPPLHKN